MKRYDIIGKDNKMYNRIYSLIFSKQKTCVDISGVEYAIAQI